LGISGPARYFTFRGVSALEKAAKGWRTASLSGDLSNFYRQHDRSFQSMIPVKRQEGEIPHEVLRSFADIMAMHSE
jgi:hypothetical protein